MAKITEAGALKGLRREMTRADFERLCRLQCRIPQFLGYAGTSREKLERWCRRTYHVPLEEAVEMIRQDGIIEIRETAFDLMKKNASLANQQCNRFLAAPDEEGEGMRDAAVRAFTDMLQGVDEDAVEEVFS